jgi:uncharacterized protein (TIGR03118 family)
MSVTTDGGFVDPHMPPGYAPFGIANIDGDLFCHVCKAGQTEARRRSRQRSRICRFDTVGHLPDRFASRGTLNSPWGVTRASFAFGPFSGKILVGNFGNGHISVFDNDGTFVDQLEDAYGNPISIDGLWTLTLGGGRNSSSDAVYFSAGPNGEVNGLFGTIMPANGH